MDVRPTARTALALTIGLVLGACSAAKPAVAPSAPHALPAAAPSVAVSQAAAPSPTASPTPKATPTALPTPRRTPVPTLRPLTREQAGPRFEAAVFAYRDRLQAIGSRDGTTLRCLYAEPPTCKASQLESAKAHWLDVAASLDRYREDLTQIGFPKAAATAAAAHIDELETARTAAKNAGAAATIEEHNELAAKAASAIARSDESEYNLMEALDWIIGP